MISTTAAVLTLLGAVTSALARRESQRTLRTALRMGYATMLLRRGLSVPDVERLVGAVTDDGTTTSSPPALPARISRPRRVA